MSGTDDKFRPVTAADVADDNPRMLANRIDHMSRSMDSGFERMEMHDQRALTMLEQVKELVADLIRSVAEHGQRITELERGRIELERGHRDTQRDLRDAQQRLAELERRQRRPRKK